MKEGNENIDATIYIQYRTLSVLITLKPAICGPVNYDFFSP